ncbi:MAG: hypothetical protein ACREUQ_12315, partial [Burkholderiales bacterium]
VYVAWLKDLGARGHMLRWLPWLGVLAAILLVLYATFLGTEGTAYRWMRRYGVIVYFGFSFLCMLIAAGHLWEGVRAATLRVPARLDLALIALLAATLLMGLANVVVPPLLAAEDAKNRLENLFEWYAGLAFTLYFLGLAWIWQRVGLTSRFSSDRGQRRDQHS